MAVDEEGLAGRECELYDPDGDRLRIATPRGPGLRVSASLVAVSTSPETVRARSLSEVTKASACSCVKRHELCIDVVSHPS